MRLPDGYKFDNPAAYFVLTLLLCAPESPGLWFGELHSDAQTEEGRETLLWKVAKALVISTLVTGCAVGPNFKPPEPPKVKTYTPSPLPAQTAASPVMGGSAQRIQLGEEIHGQWWTLFQSEPLDRLIRLAMTDSPSAAAAQAALRQARENMRAQFGTTWFPSVNGNLSASREQFTTAAFGQSGGGTTIFNLYHASVSVSYLLDFFGVSRRALEALGAQVDYQLFELQETYLTLTAN
ncbi:MAG: TolC family protein, partial [Desulfosarcinaceae bacterium]